MDSTLYPIIGQEPAMTALNQSLSGGKIPHAWIFVGPKGVGKSKAAYSFARDLLGLNWQAPDMTPTEKPNSLFGDPDPEPQQDFKNVSFHDPKHPLFTQVQNKAHPDLLVIDQYAEDGEIKNEINVEDIRGAVKFLRSTSGAGGWRVVVIDDAERMNKNASNALLKILEEPPQRAVLILIASTLGRFPPTIRSRCRLLNFKSLSYGETLSILQKEYPHEDPRRLQLAASLADGSAGQGKRILDGAGEAIHNEITGLLAGVPNFNEIKLLDCSEQFFGAKSKETQELAIGFLLKALRDTITKAGLNGALEEYQRNMLNHRPLPYWLDVYQDLQEWAEQMRGLYMDPKQIWMNSFARMADIKIANA